MPARFLVACELPQTLRNVERIKASLRTIEEGARTSRKLKIGCLAHFLRFKNWWSLRAIRIVDRHMANKTFRGSFQRHEKPSLRHSQELCRLLKFCELFMMPICDSERERPWFAFFFLEREAQKGGWVDYSGLLEEAGWH
jgi:hypothetical protein